MVIYNLCKDFFNVDEKNIKELLLNYFHNELLDKIYFIPKKVDKKLIVNKINDSIFLDKVISTISCYKNKNVENIIHNKIKKFELDTSYRLDGVQLYVIIGLDTTTIYSIKYNDEDVTVLLLESTNGLEENLDILLAHEFTHFIRKQIFKNDIFENSIGERFIVEGIGCNYSREIVPNKDDYIYCIVNKETVDWVKKNIEKIEVHMKDKIYSNELMSDYFYMYSDKNKTGILPRSGYVYGYLKVKEYLTKNNLKVKDILSIEWYKILGIK